MDYYTILGVDKNASPDDIRKAYKKKSMQHHPDRGGNEEEFKRVNEAYQTLGDTQKRGMYDHSQTAGRGGFDFQQQNFEDVFSSMFGGGFGNSPNRHQPKNKNITIPVILEPEEMFTGKTVSIRVPGGNGQKETIQLNIPPYVQPGQSVIFQGLGDNTITQFARGDLIAVVRYSKHHYWNIDGIHVRSTENIPLLGLLKGTSVVITTIDKNDIKLNIPKGTKPGTTFSLAGQGLPASQRKRGNAYIKINTVLPNLTDSQLMEIENILNT